MNGDEEPFLNRIEQVRLLRMASRTIGDVLGPELNSRYAISVARALSLVLDNAALAVESGDTDAGGTASLAGIVAAGNAQSAAIAAASAREEERLAAIRHDITVESVNAYTGRIPALDEQVATAVVQLPGGFSKETFLVETAAGGGFVIRRDLAYPPAPGSAADEFPVLDALVRKGLPVPRPLAAERDPAVFGYPFLISERVAGENAGMLSARDPAAGRQIALDLAAILGRLHALDPAEVGRPTVLSPQAELRAYIQSWGDAWRATVTDRHWLIDAGLDWLMRHVPGDIARLVPVHGDARPDNMLADAGGHATALLDWEFIHAGDPAEDFEYAWQYVAHLVDRETFAAAYRAAGGGDHGADRAQFYQIWQNTRNLMCLDFSWRAFASGDWPSYTAGVPTILYRRMLRDELARHLIAAAEAN